MCLSLLTACGSGNTATDDKPSESENAASSTEQPKESEKPEESEEPKEEEPEESAEPTQEPKEENNAGTEFLALLQEEYQNGFFEGEGPKHTYYGSDRRAFIHNGVAYICGVKGYGGSEDYCSYDIATKEFHESVSVSTDLPRVEVAYDYFVDGNFYFAHYGFGEGETRIYDCNGTQLNSFRYAANNDVYFFFEKGILAMSTVDSSVILLSHNLEKIADIPAPQYEVEHGLKEDFELNAGSTFVAGGTVYTKVSDKGSWYLYRLNADTYEWEVTGNVSDFTNQVGIFCGKYVTRNDGVYDRLTGEQVFEYGDLYPAVSEWGHDNLCYFGGDKYLGVKDKEYRWVNLKDLSMSDPLPFPEGKMVTILDDTYCVYEDSYGWFLWNYNDGTEETIVMFDN